MDLKVFKYFLTVAQEENITKAAKLLHLTQPTLSRQMMLLEEYLGVKLLDRNRHSVILTEEGKIFAARAKEVVTLCEDIQQEMSGKKDYLRGEIAIGCMETNGMKYLAEQLSIFQKQHPLVQIKLYSAAPDDIVKKMEDGTLNLGLLTDVVNLEKYDFVRTDQQDHWGIWTCKDSPLASLNTMTSKDLVNEPLIIPMLDTIKNEWNSWCEPWVDMLNVRGSYDQILNGIIMIKAGFGTLLGADYEINDDNMCFVPLSPPITSRSVLAWKKEQAFSLPVLQFIRQLRNKHIYFEMED